jgi:FecR protein
MNKKSPSALALACVLAVSLAIPFDTFADGQTAGARAGEVSRLIPAVIIDRSSKSINASAKTIVDWQDVIHTQANARARVALDDGSVLNLGADSSVRVTQHNAAAQQTELEISLGKMRTQAQKITQPSGKFEVHTPAGVAGVVGTDFYTAYENNVMTVIVFEGIVKVCNVAGVCVIVKPGQMTTIRNNDSANPVVEQATLGVLSDAVMATRIEEPVATHPAPHFGWGAAVFIAVAVAIPIAIGAHGGTSKGQAVSLPPPSTTPIRPVAPAPVQGVCPPDAVCGLP